MVSRTVGSRGHEYAAVGRTEIVGHARRDPLARGVVQAVNRVLEQRADLGTDRQRVSPGCAARRRSHGVRRRGDWGRRGGGWSGRADNVSARTVSVRTVPAGVVSVGASAGGIAVESDGLAAVVSPADGADGRTGGGAPASLSALESVRPSLESAAATDTDSTVSVRGGVRVVGRVVGRGRGRALPGAARVDRGAVVALAPARDWRSSPRGAASSGKGSGAVVSSGAISNSRVRLSAAATSRPRSLVPHAARPASAASAHPWVHP